MRDIDIFLSINNRETVLQLPVIPEEFTISSPHNNETYTTVNQGDIKMVGLSGLKSISISSFFPSKEYPFNRNNDLFGWEYVELIESWKEMRIPMRITITETPINMAVSLESFDYGVEDGSGDINYTLSFEEFKLLDQFMRRRV